MSHFPYRGPGYRQGEGKTIPFGSKVPVAQVDGATASQTLSGLGGWGFGLGLMGYEPLGGLGS